MLPLMAVLSAAWMDVDPESCRQSNGHLPAAGTRGPGAAEPNSTYLFNDLQPLADGLHGGGRL